MALPLRILSIQLYILAVAVCATLPWPCCNSLYYMWPHLCSVDRRRGGRRRKRVMKRVESLASVTLGCPKAPTAV